MKARRASRSRAHPRDRPVLVRAAPAGCAVHQLSEPCRTHGITPRFVTSGELAHALHAEFPALALEFLGVQVDTGQILSIDEFVAASTKNTLTTPLDTDFCFRDSDLEMAAAHLESSSVLLFGGRPGVGKSRLALEVVRRYGSAHSVAQVRCIVHRGPDLFEDLQVQQCGTASPRPLSRMRSTPIPPARQTCLTCFRRVEGVVRQD